MGPLGSITIPLGNGLVRICPEVIASPISEVAIEIEIARCQIEMAVFNKSLCLALSRRPGYTAHGQTYRKCEQLTGVDVIKAISLARLCFLHLLIRSCCCFKKSRACDAANASFACIGFPLVSFWFLLNWPVTSRQTLRTKTHGANYFPAIA
ncbi:hypothetical protein D9M68_666490 [compost metagenome]